LYMNQAAVRSNGAALGGLSANQVLSIGITAPVTLSDGQSKTTFGAIDRFEPRRAIDLGSICG